MKNRFETALLKWNFKKITVAYTVAAVNGSSHGQSVSFITGAKAAMGKLSHLWEATPTRNPKKKHLPR